MIKANELGFENFWNPGEMGERLRADAGYLIYEVEHSANIFLVTAQCYYNHGDQKKILFCKQDYQNAFSIDQAKAACQAHYNEMARSIVDMEHLKQIIRDAIEYGFNAGQDYTCVVNDIMNGKVNGEACIQHEVIGSAQKIFLKTLEPKEAE